MARGAEYYPGVDGGRGIGDGGPDGLAVPGDVVEGPGVLVVAAVEPGGDY